MYTETHLISYNETQGSCILNRWVKSITETHERGARWNHYWSSKPENHVFRLTKMWRYELCCSKLRREKLTAALSVVAADKPTLKKGESARKEKENSAGKHFKAESDASAFKKWNGTNSGGIFVICSFISFQILLTKSYQFNKNTYKA